MDEDKGVKVNTFSAETLTEIEVSLSPDRFATYLAHTGGDREAAVRLYTWNTAVSAAFYGPLQALEIALRNAMHGELSNTYGADWYDCAAAGLDRGASRKVMQSKTDLQRNKYAVDPPHVIASLSFGFWVSLLGPGGYLDETRARKANYEMTLWRPALRRAFPHAVTLNRAGAHRPLDFLRSLRNRIAHHEPIFVRHLQQDYQNILELTGWISPHKRVWIEVHSRVPELLAVAKDDPDVRF